MINSNSSITLTDALREINLAISERKYSVTLKPIAKQLADDISQNYSFTNNPDIQNIVRTSSTRIPYSSLYSATYSINYR